MSDRISKVYDIMFEENTRFARLYEDEPKKNKSYKKEDRPKIPSSFPEKPKEKKN
jgi:hypothetical protein